MRTKHFNKKLVLNKTTVAHLNGHEMRNIFGGAKPETHKDSRCFTCVETEGCPPETADCFPPPPSSVVTSCMDC